MEYKEIIDKSKYWEDSSNSDVQVARDLLRSKHYPQCLFFCHLSLEKALKSIIIKDIKIYPPYTHDLRKLAEITDIKLSLKQTQLLDKISAFNIAGRYGDEKLKFYKEYNKKTYAEKQLKVVEELILWLRKESQKK